MVGSEHNLESAVRNAAARADVRQSVAAMYADVQGAIDARQPRCEASGRCCRFDEYGHRLYVTTLELATFASDLVVLLAPRSAPTGAGTSRLGVLQNQPADGGACPFQTQRLCSVHMIRPFGCRMFYCDPSATDWQNEQYERFHARLKRLHEALDVPYFYLEWRVALNALSLSQTHVPL